MGGASTVGVASHSTPTAGAGERLTLCLAPERLCRMEWSADRGHCWAGTEGSLQCFSSTCSGTCCGSSVLSPNLVMASYGQVDRCAL